MKRLYSILVQLGFLKSSFKYTILSTPYTENEWPNFNKYVVIMEEEERDENNIRGFIKLIEQHE